MTDIRAGATETESAGSRRGARGPYAKGIRRRKQIIDRTLSVVAERGIDATSLRAIGEAIGVSHGVLTNYFESREKLLIEVVRQHDDQVRDSLTTDALFGRLAQAAQSNVKVPEFIALYTMLLATSVEPHNEAATEFFRDRFDRARIEMVETIRADRSLPEVDEGEVQQIASLILAALDGLQVQWLLDRDLDIADTLRLLKRLFESGR